jgi:hypothetical protein
VGKANGSRKCAPDGVPTIFSPTPLSLAMVARRKSAFAHPAALTPAVLASEDILSTKIENDMGPKC